MIRESVLKDSKLNSPKATKKNDPPKKSQFNINPNSEPDVLISENSNSNSDMMEIAEEKLFTDTRLSKDLFSKWISIRLFLALLLAVNLSFALVIYEYLAFDPSNETRNCKLFSALNTIITFFSICTWITAGYYKGKLKRERLDLSVNVSFIQDYGYYNFAFIIFLFLLHPFEPLINVGFFWNESYFEASLEFSEYDRPTIEHLIIIQIVLNTLLFIKIMLESIKYANNRSQRIASFFDMKIDFVYMLRATMMAYPLFVVAVIQVFGIIFIGVLLRIAESGYMKHVPKDIDDEEFVNELNFRSRFFLYANSFWNVLITMSTVGYGDIFCRSTYGRFFAIIAGVYGMLSTSLSVVAFTNLLAMESDEDNAFNIIQSIQGGRKADFSAIKLTSNILLAGCSYFKGDVSERISYKEKFLNDIKDFVASHNEHRMLSMDEYTYVNTKAFKLTSNLKKWDIENSIRNGEDSREGLEFQ